MTFKIFTDTGKTGGPYGSLPLAMKHARAKLAEDTRCKAVELRPSLSHFTGSYGAKHRLSFYKTRADL